MIRLKVAAGILIDAAGRVLIAERLCDGPFNGLWEFPGGKIRAGETSREALVRELAEEIGVEIKNSQLFMSLSHEYPDRCVEIDFFLIEEWHGDAHGQEGQRLRWVDSMQLDANELLPADVPVVAAIKQLQSLPSLQSG